MSQFVAALPSLSDGQVLLGMLLLVVFVVVAGTEALERLR